VFGNRTLRKIFGLKKEEITGGWRKLCKKLRDMYSSPNFIRIIKSGRMGSAGRMGGSIHACRFSVGKPEEKRPLGRPRFRWEHNLKIVLKVGMRGGGLDSSGSG
jgi:hypothetical protein